MTQISTIEMYLRFIDPEPERRHWNGGPFPSAKAHETHLKAVEAAEQVVRDAGFQIVGVGHGIYAKEYE